MRPIQMDKFTVLYNCQKQDALQPGSSIKLTLKYYTLLIKKAKMYHNLFSLFYSFFFF